MADDKIEKMADGSEVTGDPSKGTPRDLPGDDLPVVKDRSYPLTPTMKILNPDGSQHLTPSEVRSDPSVSEVEEKAKKTTKRTPKKSAAKCDLELKLLSQRSRLQFLSDTETLVSSLTSEEGSAQLKARLTMVNQEWDQFVAIHDYMGFNCTEDFLESSYVKEGIFDLAYRSCVGARTRLTSLINECDTPAHQPVAPVQVVSTAQQVITLPPLNIKKFSGDYAQWPEFRDMFTTAVIKRDGLTGVQRLQYLKSYLIGSAAQLVANAPLCDAQFSISWDAVCPRYENQRLLVGAQLDKLLNLEPMTSRSFQQLDRLINHVNQALNALKAQNMLFAQGGSMLLTQLIISKLDRYTREAYKSS